MQHTSVIKQEEKTEMDTDMKTVMDNRLMGCKIFNQMRLEKQLCDILIRVDDGELHAHKIILCRYSPYFLALFTNHLSTPNMTECRIPDVSSEIMELILEYVYTQHVNITEENMDKLLVTADHLQVSGLVDECCSFLEAKLCLKNCIGIWHFAHIYFFRKLEQQAFRFILHNFTEMVQVSEEFLDLTVEQLSEITENDELNVKHEDVVFQAILRWIEHEQPKRKAHIGVLLPKVRLELTSDLIIDNVRNHALVADDEACKLYISSVVAHKSDLNLFLGLDVVRPRLPSTILMVIGGWIHWNPTSAIEAYDTRARRWVSVACTDERPVAFHGTVYLNGFVYCIGGSDGFNYLSRVRRFDPITRTWAQVGPMHYCRCHVSVCVLDGCIYAMGGFNVGERMNTAERYDPESNQWSIIAPMHDARSIAGATVLNGKVYVCGGFDGSNILSTAEYYSPQTDKWTRIPSMSTRRNALGVITYYGMIYAVGGSDGRNRLRSVEVYNPQTESWESVTDMITPRCNFGIEVIDDLLFVVGGYSDTSCINYVECYDKTTNAWDQVQPIEIPCRGLSCCVVSGLPNMADYAAPRDLPPQVIKYDSIKTIYEYITKFIKKIFFSIKSYGAVRLLN